MESTRPAVFLPGDNVLLVAHSQYRAIYVGMARLLKERLGVSVQLCVATGQEADYYRDRFGEIFQSITVARALYDACREPPGEPSAVFAKARDIERRLATTYNALALSDRHLGRGYALGGFKHPRSHISEGTSYLQMVSAFNAVTVFWQKLLDEFAPRLVIGFDKVLCVLCRERGIPVRIISSSRFQSYYYWAHNEFREHPTLSPAFAKALPDPKLTLAQPYAAHLVNRDRTRREATLFRTAKQAGLMLARHYYWRLKRYEKARGYFATENAGMLVRRYRDIGRLDSANCSSLAEIAAAGPYIFFPLATEPEAALQTISPEYFFQLEAIATLSRDMPVGVILAVKEHYAAMGRRPTDFYRQISEFKNVRMMRVSEFGLDAVAKSAAVATISGTAGFEAAALGKPVIAFGRHNLYNIVPHVHVVTSGDNLVSVLASIVDGRFDAEQARRDGQRFLRAIVDSSFDLEGFAPAKPDQAPIHALEAAFLNLVSGLRDSLDRKRECVSSTR